MASVVARYLHNNFENMGTTGRNDHCYQVVPNIFTTISTFIQDGHIYLNIVVYKLLEWTEIWIAAT